MPSGTRPLIAAVVGFLLPLAIFFAWFFSEKRVGLRWVLADIAFLMLVSVVCGTLFKSPLLRIGMTWLFTGCVAALFWTLLLGGFG